MNGGMIQIPDFYREITQPWHWDLSIILLPVCFIGCLYLFATRITRFPSNPKRWNIQQAYFITLVLLSLMSICINLPFRLFCSGTILRLGSDTCIYLIIFDALCTHVMLLVGLYYLFFRYERLTNVMKRSRKAKIFAVYRQFVVLVCAIALLCLIWRRFKPPSMVMYVTKILMNICFGVFYALMLLTDFILNYGLITEIFRTSAVLKHGVKSEVSRLKAKLAFLIITHTVLDLFVALDKLITNEGFCFVPLLVMRGISTLLLLEFIRKGLDKIPRTDDFYSKSEVVVGRKDAPDQQPEQVDSSGRDTFSS